MFKIGDWVSCYYLEYKKIFKINDIGMSSEVLYGFDVNSEIYDLKLCELWQPKEDELCWFWNETFKPTIANFYFKSDSDNKYYTSNGEWKYCEPFLGPLPSFLKDK